MQPPSRRTFLALGLLLTTGGALTACTDSHDGKDATEGEHRRPDPDEPVRLRAVAATDTLLAGYDALLAGPGAGQAAQLQPLRAEAAQHRAALAAGLPGAQASSSAASASATPGSASPSASATGGAAAAVTSTAALASLERQTAQTRLADLGAASPQLARLLASVSTAGVLHAVALGDTAPPTVPAPGPGSASPSASGSLSPSSSGAGSSASGSPSAAPSGAGSAAAVGPEAVTAFQTALSAEHAAIYGYGVVGARLPEDQQRADARTALAAHQTRRDAWQRLLGGAGATPNAAAAGYQLPFPVADAAAAGRLAAHIETRLTTVYADLVAAVDGTQRTTAADALRECALRARHWGAAPTAFPGIPDPAAAPASGAPTAAPTPAATG
ncbi:ferritin-like domain-containing protein [Streptomyces sp. CB01881]|uniref:ferritin-like domain-containing protein n=1 Tax=Streptomyces sp. CB01881 TaxID=2078691 RepID=UPI000CDBDC48|nr:hypothetical protein C2142_25450 [Streptomyces sp. CB01881]TYC71956.1 DUF4439 domain-containing protein [Streptomyces sp. CB01881]